MELNVVKLLINPWCACTKVMVVFLCVRVCVCLCVCYHASYYIPHLYVEIKVALSFLCHFLHMRYVEFVETLCSEVLATFADHLCLLRLF